MKIAPRLFILLATFAALLYMGGVNAVEIKIGVVNMAKLLQQAPQAQEATKVMHEKFDNRGKTLQAEQDKIKNLQDQINRNGAIMSASQLQNLQTQLDTLQQDFNRKQVDFQDDVNAERNEELGKLQQAILKAVQEFAKTQKYNLIIGEGVFYADGTVDVTGKVLDQLQKDFQTRHHNSGSGGK
ncbi:MAG: OmpH/Skp family outer membrane protein [Gammaproteobacteria bacterium]